MAVKSLAQITREIGNVYNPQVRLLQQRQAAIPGQIQAEEQGLQAKQTQAFDEIIGGARRRGLGFAGIPVGEQAKYNATEYMPALARLRQSGQERATSLEEAILGVRERQSNMANQMREGLLSRDMALRQMREQRRQFDLNLAEQRRAAARASSAAASFAPTLGGGGGGSEPSNPYAVKRKKDGGFAFSYNGQPVSAAVYAQGTGQTFRNVLQAMAKKGDRGAKAALGFVGDDFGYDPGRIGNNKGIYNALTWGLR